METSNAANLRRCEREQATISVSLVLKSEKSRTDPSATTIDISTSGVGVRTTLALVPGEWVGIVPKGQFPQAIAARVAWAREDASDFWTIAGLTFLDTPEV
jgi:hypothetical protein